MEGSLFLADDALTQNNDEQVLEVDLSCRRATPFPLVLEDLTERPNSEPLWPLYIHLCTKTMSANRSSC